MMDLPMQSTVDLRLGDCLELMRDIPSLYAQEELGENAIAYIKFFTPDSNWMWFAIEGCWITGDNKELSLTENPIDGMYVLFFGFIRGEFDELTYFSLRELKRIGAACDLSWQPRTIAKCRRDP